MDTIETANTPGASIAVPPLKSKRRNGAHYQRLEVVDAQIARLSRMPESERAGEFRHARPEVIAHFIRNGGRGIAELYALLCLEFIRRVAARVRQHTWGYPKLVVEEIGMNVELAMMKLVLSGEPVRQADFLEVNFYSAAEGRIRNAILGWKASATGGRRGWIRTDETDEEGDEIERTIELVPGNDPGPADRLLVSEDSRLVQKVIQLVRAEIKDNRQLEATILNCCQGWPVRSTDPQVASLESRFGVSDRTVERWRSRTLRIMHRMLFTLTNGEVL